MFNSKNIYIIGIGGISLSSIALLLKNRGACVKGSDLVYGMQVENLQRKGFEVVIGHSSEFVRWADIIIFSSAISNDDEDIVLARKLGKILLSRAEVLGEISKGFKTISVAGCHGKTTTTGMISSVLLLLDKKPNIHIGGILKGIDDNVFVGNSNLFVTEACEYKDSFLYLSTDVGVILNVKPDHLDYFKNFDNVKKSFQKFAKNINKNGVLVANGDDVEAKTIIKTSNCKTLTFGFDVQNDYHATNVVEYANGKFAFSCLAGGKLINVKLPVFGFHNIFNALATIAVCDFLNVEPCVIKEGIENFKGISRRFERVFEDENKVIIHDYAHHPDEIKASIEAGRRLKKDRLIVVFQPHTFSRTRDFFDEFCENLSLADEVWLLPIYPAREKPIKGVSSYQIYKKIRKNNKNTRYFASFSAIFSKLRQIDDNSLVLILGAGDVEQLARMFKI